jgi:uncharacterized cupredoxin-like copper-binding protein
MFGPKIVAQNNEHDFGEVQEGTSVTHNFIVSNSGGDVLKISNVRASCGCTAASPEKKELAPGESTTIKVSFNSSGREGHQEKYVYVNSNDPKTPELKLKFTCDVIKNDKNVSQLTPQIKFASDQHDFGKVKEGKIVDYVFDFKNEGKSTLEIKDIKTSCGCTAALVSKKKIEPGQQGTLRVELDTKNRTGRMSRTISVRTNDPEQPDKVLTIYAEVIKE